MSFKNRITTVWQKITVPKHLETLTLYLIILRMLGIFFPHHRLQGIYKVAQCIYCCLVVVMINVMIVSLEWIDAFQVIRTFDLKTISENLCLSINYLSCLYKIFNLNRRRKEILKMFDFARNFSNEFATRPEHAAILAGNERRICIITRTFLFLALLVNVSSAIEMVADAEKALEHFPYRTYRPEFIPVKYFGYLISMMVIWNAMNVCVHDSLVMVLLTELYSQLMVLDSSLQSMRAGENYPISSLKVELISVIRYHQCIRQFMHVFEQTFSYVLLIQFLASMFMFGLVGFQATVTKEYSRTMISMAMYCVCIFLELYLFCSLAHQIIEQGKKIAPSLYSCEWYACGKTFGQYLLFFITHAQSPMTISAGGFFIVSLETFTQVLIRSYSYVALLRQAYLDTQ